MTNMTEQTPPTDTPCTLRFRDSMGEYQAGPFVNIGGRWVHQSKPDLPAQGEVIGWTRMERAD
jgi:hypothetical protein